MGFRLRRWNNVGGAHASLLIIVLNDNEWSIDRNVGSIAKYLHKIVTNEHYSESALVGEAYCGADRRQDGGDAGAAR